MKYFRISPIIDYQQRWSYNSEKKFTNISLPAVLEIM